MSFRVCLVALAWIAALSGPCIAQTPGKTWRIGFMHSGSRSPPSIGRSVDAFVRGMRDLGYVEGKNLQIEWRFAEGKLDRLPAMAADLVHEQVAIIVAGPISSVRAAQRATSSIPIVMAAIPDPLEAVSNLRHPGGNTTGMTIMTLEIVGKWVELVHDTFPNVTRIAVFANGNAPLHEAYLGRSEAAAKSVGVRIIPIRLTTAGDVESAVQTAVRERAGAIVVTADPFLVSLEPQINRLSIRNRLPTIYGSSTAVELDGLMSYGVNFAEQWKQAAVFVDKILKGAKAGDLPVEQPTKFELVVNLKTAKALGLTIPQSILLRADRVIE